MNQIQKFSTVVKKKTKKQAVGVTVWAKEPQRGRHGGQGGIDEMKKMEMEKAKHNLLDEIVFLWFWASCVFFQHMTPD